MSVCFMPIWNQMIFRSFNVIEKNTPRQKLIWMLELFYSRPATAAAVKKKYRLRAHLFVVYSVQMYNVDCTMYMHIRLTFNFFFSQSPSKSHFFSFFPFLKILSNYFLLPTSLLIFQLSHNFSVHFVVDP